MVLTVGEIEGRVARTIGVVLLVGVGVAAIARAGPCKGAPWADCGGQCVDLTADAANCGACDAPCAQGMGCFAGLCASDPAVAPGGGGDPGVWTQITPNLGGRLDGVVEQPGNPNVLAVASPGGGVWFTTDDGASWSQPYVVDGVVSSLADFTVVHLEWDAAVPDRLFAETLSDIYATGDLGQTWTNLTNNGGDPAPLMPRDHATDPAPFAQLVIGATRIVIAALPCEGLLYSYDGSTFRQAFPFSGGSSNLDNCIQSIAADPVTDYVFIATMGGGPWDTAHLFRSHAPWTASTPDLRFDSDNTGLPQGVTVKSIASTSMSMPPASPVVGEAVVVEQSSVSTVYLSSDGINWSAAGSVPGSSWDPRTLVYEGHNQLLLGALFPFYSPNLSSWYLFNLPRPGQLHDDVRSFYLDVNLVAGHQHLWTSTDGSDNGSNLARWSWTDGSTPVADSSLLPNPGVVPVVGPGGLPVWQTYTVAPTTFTNASGGKSVRLFAAVQDNRPECSDDMGSSWTTTSNGTGAGEVEAMMFSSVEPNVGYFIGDGQTVAAITRNASAGSCSAGAASPVTWTSCAPTGSPALVGPQSMAVHPLKPLQVYFVEAYDVALSSDGCASTTASAPLPAYLTSLWVDGAGVIYAGTNGAGAFSSADNGRSWQPWGLNAVPPAAIWRIAWSPRGGLRGTFFMATTDGLYRGVTRPTGPGAPSWTRVAGGGGYSASAVTVDPACPNRVYLGLGADILLGQHRGGVLESTDLGSTWTSLTGGLALHQTGISDLQVDPLTSEFLFAASYGLGGWIYDSGSTACP